jgi:tetratricopeptide (TPR) repeat protein
VELDPAYASTISSDLEQAGLEMKVIAAEKIAEGDALAELGRLDDAIEAYEQAVQADPGSSLYHVKLGDAYRTLGDDGEEEKYEDALEAYGKAIENVDDQDPELPGYYALRASLYARLGRSGDAIDDYARAIGLDGTVAAYYVARAPLYVRVGQNGAAIADYEQAIELEPDNPLLHEALAQLYYDLERYDEAIEALTTATQLNPQRGPAFYLLGLAHERIADADAAIGAFTTCTEVTESEVQREQCEDELAQLEETGASEP